MGSHDDGRLSVSILGGGIAGLTLLRGLLQYPHLDPIVYEATAEYGDVGGGIALHKNAITAMESIDPAIKASYLRGANSMLADEEVEMDTRVIMAEGPFSGELLASLGRAKGRKTISRYDLLNGFCSLVPRDRIRFGKRANRIEDHENGSVTTHFEDGSSATADCVIASDGIHSRTRHHLLGSDHPAADPKNHDEWLLIGKAIPSEHALKHLTKWTDFVPIIIGSKGYFNMMPLDKGKTWNVGCVTRGEATQENVNKTLDPTAWQAYDPEVQNILTLLRDGPGRLVFWNLMDHDAAPLYHRNNVAMIGDAAHATYPFIGNGAAQALEDSAVLHAIFAQVKHKQDITLAFQAFETTRKERSQKVVEASRQCGRIDRYEVDDVPGADPYTREGVDAIKKRYREIGMFTNEVDVYEQNERGVKEFERLLKTRK